MEETKEELAELKKFFVDDGWVDGLFQILFLLEDINPGVDLQQERKRTKLRELRNMLCWFGLYVSMRHGGYATKNKELYKEWNSVFGFKKDAEKFLGYPHCCIEVHNLFVPVVHIQLYSLIKQIRLHKQSIQDLKQFLVNFRFLHHIPCKINCTESIGYERRYETIIKKYDWLVKDLLSDFEKRKIRAWIQGLQLLPTQLRKDELRNIRLLLRLGINLKDFMEILENKKNFKENALYGESILKSFL